MRAKENRPGVASSAWWKCRRSQMDITGTNVIESMKAVNMAKPTAMASGTNKPREAPSIKNDGKNTARTHSMASRLGTTVSAVPIFTAVAIDLLVVMRV